MTYKVGDKVYIKEVLVNEYWVGLTDEMIKFQGQTATITAVFKSWNAYNGYLYRIDLDNQRWVWCKEYFDNFSKFKSFLESLSC